MLYKIQSRKLSESILIILFLSAILLTGILASIKGISISKLILGMFGLILLGISFLKPSVGLINLMLVQYFFVGASENVSYGETFYVILLIVILISSLLFLIMRKESTQLNRLYLLLFIFIAYCLFSIIPAHFNGVSAFNWMRDLSILLNYLILIVFLRERVNNRQILFFFWLFIVISSLITLRDLLYNLDNRGFNVNILSSIIRTPGSPVYYHSALFLSSGLIIYETRRKLKVILGLLIMLFIANIIISKTRTYWIGFLISLVVFSVTVSIIEKRRHTFQISLSLISIAVIIIIVLNLSMPKTFSRLEERLDFSSDSYKYSLQARINEREAALKAFRKQPIFGQGLGYNLESYARPYLSVVDGTLSRRFLHDSYLFILLKLGIIGYVLFLLFIIQLIIDIYKKYRLAKPSFYKGISIGYFAGMIGICFLSLATAKFTEIPTALFITIFGGLILGFENQF